MALAKTAIIINIIVLIIFLVLISIMCIYYVKGEIKHKKEKEKLKESRDYHINELKERSGIKDVDLH